MAEGALPKGFERPSDSGSQGDSSSSAPKKRGADKMGISIAIGITAVALIIGIGFTGVIPFGDDMPSIMQPAPSAPSAPVVQQAPPSPPSAYVPMKSTPSYTPANNDMIDRLDWSISEGDVVGMYLDKGDSSLVVHTITPNDGELFVGLNADYIGSDDGTFFILVDNQEHEDYEQAGMDLYIDLPAGAETVEIIGSYVIL
uniref:Uncharacterized protein n=1 Tax=uncultured marine thaumarchaeote KM3_01_G08 TaxID=1455954 RepID=A0A075G2D2_9ARCH|nr:hypothetical protein [uncultured marine thaumarchaeote KM3_01_G08]